MFVDTKFEFGYVTDQSGQQKLIYMDEVGTPDSSRIWDGPAFREGRVLEQSKEAFRQQLLNHFPDPDILLNKERMHERAPTGRTQSTSRCDVNVGVRNLFEHRAKNHGKQHIYPCQSERRNH